MFDRFRKPKIIKARRLPDNTAILDIDSLDTLKKDFEPIFETKNCFFAIDSGNVVRVRKSGFKPTIRKVQKISIQPTDKIFLSQEELFNVAADQDHTIWETEDAFLLLSSGMVLICEKLKKKVTK